VAKGSHRNGINETYRGHKQEGVIHEDEGRDKEKERTIHSEVTKNDVFFV